MDLKGKSVIITGAVSGIGLACVKEYLRNGVKKVVILDLNESMFKEVGEELESEFGANRFRIIKTDITDAKEFEDSFAKAVEELEEVDIVHNNAGILSEQLWSKLIDVNFKGVTQGILLGLKYMSKENGGKGGAIVNTASIAGLGGIPPYPIYSASKCAIIGLTVSFGASENFERTGVRIMAMCPGVTDTDIFFKNLYTDNPMNKDKVGQERKKIEISKQTPEHVAKSILYMLQNGVTGSVYIADAMKTYETEIPKYYPQNEYKLKQVL